MRGSYNTKQRELVRAFLESSADKSFTVSQVYDALCGEIGKTTVYRALTSLEAEGIAARYPANGAGSDSFQYRTPERCRDHIHLKCECCGSVSHLDCNFMDELSSHVKEGHHFTIDNGKTVLYGICEKCKGNN